MTALISAEEAFDLIEHPFRMNNPEKLRIC